MTDAKSSTLGRYRLLEPIGRGSMAEAYKAKSFGVEGFEKTLVVKCLLPELSSNRKFVESFVQQARRAVRLSHTNVVQLIDLGRAEANGTRRYYVASEYVAGMTFAELLARLRAAGEPAPVELCLYVTSELGKALDHAHRRRDDELRSASVVHCNLSPSNVLLSWEGEVKLSDFCVARALYDTRDTLEHVLVSKYAYASPELVRGDAPTFASDLFGLGSLLFEALSGQNPFVAGSAAETKRRVESAEHPPLDQLRAELRPELVTLVHRLLLAKPEDRPESAAELHELLLAELYRAGGRFEASDVATLLERLGKPATPSVPVAQALEPAAETPPSRREPRRPPEPVESKAPSGPPETRIPSVSEPPWSGLSARREISVLVMLVPGTSTPAVLERARQALLRYGGQLVGEVSQEVCAVFGLEQQDARDAENAVRCGLVMLRAVADSANTPSIGIEVGRVRLLPDESSSDPAELEKLVASARALAAAHKGRIAIAKHAERNLRGLFELDPAPDAGAKAWLVREQRSADGAFETLVGRKQELRRIGELLAQSSRKSSQVVGLVGEPGIGKTRLLLEMQRRIAKSGFDIAIYIATCPPRGHELAHSAMVVMLRALCGVREGDLHATLDDVGSRLRALGLPEEELQAVLSELGASVRDPSAESWALLPGAISRMLASLAEDRVQVFVWDDAHEMDAESAALLANVVERASHSRILFLFGARPTERSSFRSLPRYTELPLGPLDPDDVVRLVAERLGVEEVPPPLLEFLGSRAGGHPMFIEELLHAAKESGALSVRQDRVEARLNSVLAVPRPLSTLLADRVRRLPEDAQRLIVAASVLGAPADSAVLASMLGVPLGKLNALAQMAEERGLLRRDGPVELSFPSPLLPEVVIDGLEPDARIDLHRKAASAYEAVLGEQADPGRVARHLAEAGERARAAEAFARSGFAAISARRLDRATSDLARAVELALETKQTKELVAWTSALSGAVRRVRSGVELAELARRLVTHLESDPNLAARERVAVTIDLGLMLGSLQHYRDASRLLERAALEAAPWPELSFLAHAADAELAIQLGEFKRALALLERVRQKPAPSAERHRLLLATSQALAGAGEHARALTALDEAARTASEDPLLACERAKARALILLFQGDFQGGATASAEAANLGRAAGLLFEVAVNLHNEGDAWLRSNELPRAYAALRASLDIAEQIGSERLINLDQLMLSYLDAKKGSESAYRELGERLAHAEARRWTWDALSGRYLLGRLLIERGEPLAAKRELKLTSEMAVAAGNRMIADDCARELRRLSAET